MRLAVLVLLFAAAAARADVTARQLLELCNSGAPECHPTVQNHAVATLAAIKITEVQGGQCIVDVSKDTKREEMEDVVLSYLRPYPEQPSDDLSILIACALVGTRAMSARKSLVRSHHGADQLHELDALAPNGFLLNHDPV